MRGYAPFPPSNTATRITTSRTQFLTGTLCYCYRLGPQSFVRIPGPVFILSQTFRSLPNNTFICLHKIVFVHGVPASLEGEPAAPLFTMFIGEQRVSDLRGQMGIKQGCPWVGCLRSTSGYPPFFGIEGMGVRTFSFR